MLKVATLLVATVLVSGATRTVDDDMALFTEFRQLHNRQYAGAMEESHRFGCFRQTLQAADRLNARVVAHAASERHGITQFADLCANEFQSLYLHGQKRNGVIDDSGMQRPVLAGAEDVRRAEQQSVDWRQRGAVTPVGNQGQCGSTWAWAAVASMEAQWFLKTGTLIALSKQEIVSCDTTDAGCNGGEMENAYQWVLGNKGIDSEADYPYTSGTGNAGTCRKDKLPMHVAHFANYTELPKDEGQLLTWMAKNGPITAGVDASQGWQTYTGGIMSTCTGTNLDHAVNLVGYTAPQGSTPAYWIAKNQWSTKWGESGYIRLAYGSNQCGLTLQASSILN